MNQTVTLRDGIIPFCFADNSGSVFYDEYSGDILSLALCFSIESGKLHITEYHAYSIEKLEKRGLIVSDDA